MIQLIAAQDGHVGIAGQRYTRGLLRVRYDLDNSVTIWDPFGPIVTKAPSSDFADSATGVPFASAAALKAFIDANFFRIPGNIPIPLPTDDGFPYTFPFPLA